jgi:hypothetical protein
MTDAELRKSWNVTEVLLDKSPARNERKTP